MKPLPIFIGYDHRESVAYHVLANSIMRHASGPVAITPLYRPQLEACDDYWRERKPDESTEFSMTRFLTPYLTDFDGVSIFLDSDMLCLGDIYELYHHARANPYVDVFVRKHLYHPTTQTKFLGQPQANYPCKNWSSLMVFNGHRFPVKTLRPAYVSSAPPSDLHQFKWAQEVGEVPPGWNHLVGEYLPMPDAKLVHFTIGGPWFPEYENCEYATQWQEERLLALNPTRAIIPLNDLTGGNDEKAQGQQAKADA